MVVMTEVQGRKRAGIDGMWDDNNECTLPDDQWRVRLNGQAVPER